MIARKYVNKVVTSRCFAVRDKFIPHLPTSLTAETWKTKTNKHAGLKFFSVSCWHSKRENPYGLKLFFNKNRLDYGVPHLHVATLSVRSLIMEANANFKILGFQLLKTQ